MPETKNWVDFRHVREAVDFGEVLEAYGITLKLRGADQHHGFCPLPNHDGQKRSPSFSANLARRIFHCFGCEAKGNAIDFELKGLDANHPYLQERGLTPETIRMFGLGHCNRGMMAGRIAIPLRNTEGYLIGYAGRVVDDSLIDEENPKYRLPGKREKDGTVFEFSKGAFLFNGNRVQAPAMDLIVVEGFFSVFQLHQCGWTNAVALMGSSCSPEQAELIVKLTAEGGRIWLMPDGDDAGIRCAEDVLMRIAPHRFVRWITLDEGKDPCDYLRDELARKLPGSA